MSWVNLSTEGAQSHYRTLSFDVSMVVADLHLTLYPPFLKQRDIFTSTREVQIMVTLGPF